MHIIYEKKSICNNYLVDIQLQLLHEEALYFKRNLSCNHVISSEIMFWCY